MYNFWHSRAMLVIGYMRSDFKKSMIPNGESPKDYLGYYCDLQDEFKLVGGQIQIITKIARECQKFYDVQPTATTPKSLPIEGLFLKMYKIFSLSE